jgi:hypothetical protein
MEVGIWLRNNDIKKDEKPVTTITASIITKATFNEEVTAKAEHIPKTCNAIGLLSTKGSTRSFFLVCDITLSHF